MSKPYEPTNNENGNNGSLQDELKDLQRIAQNIEEKCRIAVMEKDKAEAEKEAIEKLLAEKTKETESLSNEYQQLQFQLTQLKKKIDESESKKEYSKDKEEGTELNSLVEQFKSKEVTLKLLLDLL